MTDARSAGADPGARGNRSPAGRAEHARAREGDDGPGPSARHPIAAYFRANPQAFVLLVICIVLGLGTFLAVLISLATAGSDQTTGEPSGAILGAHTALLAARTLVP
jgi:hypothetical protein